MAWMLLGSWKRLALNPVAAQDLWKLSTAEFCESIFHSPMPVIAILISIIDSNKDVFLVCTFLFIIKRCGQNFTHHYVDLLNAMISRTLVARRVWLIVCSLFILMQAAYCPVSDCRPE